MEKNWRKIKLILIYLNKETNNSIEITIIILYNKSIKNSYINSINYFNLLKSICIYDLNIKYIKKIKILFHI